jgi:preprotein translocase subunit Sec63
VDFDKVDEEKARRRYRRLVLAYSTLTNEEMFQNWIRYGDPEGSQAINAIQLAVPVWILDPAFRPKLMAGAIGCVFVLVLTIYSYVNKNKYNCSNGIFL